MVLGSVVRESDSCCARNTRRRLPPFIRITAASTARNPCVSDAELETWATVEWVARDLVAEGKKFDAGSVRERLSRTHAWSAKLAKPHFATTRISRAIESMLRLRIIAALPDAAR